LENFSKIFGGDFLVERILKLIEERGIKASKLLSDLGLDSGSMSHWKSGKARPSTDAIMKISEYFGVTTDYLLTGKGSPDLIFPDILKVDKIAAHRGEENWTQEEIDKLAEFARFIKSQRPQK
jgi:transcriptional regulator with XRE-family HTH domain